MTNYEQIKGLFQKFADKYKRQICIETELSSASEDKAETKRTGDKKLVYENNRQDLKIIDMDEIAHNVYRIARFPDSVKESESLASADAFAKENVVYILVVSEEKNIVDADKMRKCLLAGQKFQSDYMRKLEKYIFKEAYIYTPELLENNFVKHFKY